MLNKRIFVILPFNLLLAACGHSRFTIQLSPPSETPPLATEHAMKPSTTASATSIPNALATSLSLTTTPGLPITTPHQTPLGPPMITSTPGYWQDFDVYSHDFVAIQTHAGNEPSLLGDIATLQFNNTHLIRLTTSGFNADPVLSPNGELIAFRSVPDAITSSEDFRSRLNEGYYDIWVTTFDGKNVARLTNSERRRSIPSWSPDSRKVVFSEGPDGVLAEIDVYTGSRTEIARYTSKPKYLPDGKSIGYLTMDGGLAWGDALGRSITIVDASTLPPKTSVKDFDWTPDGNYVAYVLADEAGRVGETLLGIKYTLWMSRADGTAAQFLTGDVRSIRISPNGNFIAAIKGSGYLEECFVGRELVFLALSPNRDSVRHISLKSFQYYPYIEYERTFYPLSNVTWLSDQAAVAGFHVACTSGESPAGGYLINPHQEVMVRFTAQLVSSIEDRNP
jgi:dipeptidyl aminopeptidase/acylaminoacyl peptidase